MSKEVTRVEEENFVHNLATACKTHEDWLVLVRYGLATLLNNQPFLMELIVIEATRLADDDSRAHIKPSDMVRGILGELGLRLVVAEGKA